MVSGTLMYESCLVLVFTAHGTAFLTTESLKCLKTRLNVIKTKIIAPITVKFLIYSGSFRGYSKEVILIIEVIL